MAQLRFILLALEQNKKTEKRVETIQTLSAGKASIKTAIFCFSYLCSMAERNVPSSSNAVLLTALCSPSMEVPDVSFQNTILHRQVISYFFCIFNLQTGKAVTMSLLFELEACNIRSRART